MPDSTFPDSGEDRSLVEWWRQHPRKGWLWVEVVIGYSGPGDWPNRRSHRRIDAVHIPGHANKTARVWRSSDTDRFTQAVDGAELEIVEAKQALTFGVIGQCVAGVDMLSRAYPNHGPLRQVALVRGTPDPALRWVCDRRSIELVTIGQERVDDMRAAQEDLRPDESERIGG